jgi:ATP synthase F1 delta subunit
MADAAATPYAEALYEAARDAGRLEGAHADFEAVVGALAGSRELGRVLFNPAFPSEAKRRILQKLAEGADPLVASTLDLLVANNRIELLPDVQEAFAERYRLDQRELAVELTTAIPIDDAQADGLRQRLEQGTGQSVTIRRRVDPAIVGGVVLRVRDLLVDASVRRRLDGLRLALKSTPLRTGGQA